MKRAIVICYEWWMLGSTGSLPVPAEFVDALEESAEERIGVCMKDGYTSGELVDNVDGVNFRGHWNIGKSNSTDDNSSTGIAGGSTGK